MFGTLIRSETLAKRAKPIARRGTYFVQTWGCQMNEEDSEQLALRLESIGFSPAASILEAHVILLNTCSVRKKPEDKAFSMLGELAMLKARRPEIIIGVCGCMAQIRAMEIHKRAPHVDFVVGTGQIESVPGLVEEAAQRRKFQTRLDLPERKGAVVEEVPVRLIASEGRRLKDEGRRAEGRRNEGTGQVGSPQLAVGSPEGRRSKVEGRETEGQGDAGTGDVGGERVAFGGPSIRNPQSEIRNRAKLKAFVPIQYGCDKFCTFCIVPTTRGRERSRPTEDIVTEVRALAARGTKEVTLLGQTVNSYGKNLAEGRVPFSKLLWLLEGIPGLERIRYTSPYPRDFKHDLIACIRDNPKVMEHVHLPLQSGDDDVLRAMKRLYSVESFLDIVESLRDTIPGISITTDLIVGFPGETEEQFEHTLDVVRQVRFDGAFMFIYSTRPGTPAAEMEQLSRPVKTERLKRLAALQNAISCDINESFVGRTLEVLVEGPSPKNPKLLQGFSREFKMVHFDGPTELTGRQATIEVTQPHLWGLSGRLV